jgi:hypothetical protein
MSSIPQLAYLRVRVRKRNAILAGAVALFIAGVILGNIWANTQQEGFERHETYTRTTSRR